MIYKIIISLRPTTDRAGVGRQPSVLESKEAQGLGRKAEPWTEPLWVVPRELLRGDPGGEEGVVVVVCVCLCVCVCLREFFR